ncbi:MAG: flagellar protein FlaG [Candidatus Thiodiazotropha sp. (ex Ctena orbiculata)]|nr:flagellar protein FlaG [Candidatus Thiodiazotropha taylori]
MPNVISNLANEYAYKRDVSKTEPSPVTRVTAAKAEATEKQEAKAVQQSVVIDNKALALNVENLAQMVRRDLEFSIDEDTGTQVLRVVDSETGELVRQVPPEQILHIISQIEEMNEQILPGALLDDRV